MFKLDMRTALFSYMLISFISTFLVAFGEPGEAVIRLYANELSGAEIKLGIIK